MTFYETALIVVGVLILACVLASTLATLVPVAMQSRTAVRRRVVVNLKDGTAVAGVLWQRRGGLLVLRDASHIIDSRGPQKMDGEAIIDSDAVAFVQAPA